MAENAEPAQGGEPQTTAQPMPHGDGDGAAATDWKAEARKWEARAKENRGAAESQAKEAEKAKKAADEAKAEAEAAKAEAARLKAEKERAGAVREAAKAAGVDAELLGLMAGDGPEAIAANAEVLKAKIAEMSVYPAVHDGGAKAPAAPSREQIMGIKDRGERVRQIAAHPSLFAN